MTSEPWPAPRARGPVDAVVEVPGSKSMTNRALVLAALSPGDTLIRRPLVSRDTDLMVGGLRALGVEVQEDRPGECLVRSSGPPLAPSAARVEVGNAGTVARFLPPVAALATGDISFDGDRRMRSRPLGPLIDALRSLGVVLESSRGGMPVLVHGTGRVAGGEVEVEASASSQLISGLLLAAPAYDAGIQVRHVGPRLPSRPHLAMTVTMLRARGAQVTTIQPDGWIVRSGRLQPGVIDIEPDLSSAAPLLAAALVTGGRVTVPGWPRSSDQPGAALPALLSQMGAAYVLDATGLTLWGTGRIIGLDADLADVGELVPVLAAVAVLAQTPSRLRGVPHLRGQETDRLAALAGELTRLGGEVRETADGLAVIPRRLHGGVVATYDDHRMAMAAAVVGLAVEGVAVENMATTGKTLPEFPALWRRVLNGSESR